MCTYRSADHLANVIEQLSDVRFKTSDDEGFLEAIKLVQSEVETAIAAITAMPPPPPLAGRFAGIRKLITRDPRPDTGPYLTLRRRILFLIRTATHDNR
ncbi:MAG: hypothetical protein GY939_24020 [Actinomycetia bacterium]|nr:hypothetical protein [Actinomycetes bacterium]